MDRDGFLGRLIGGGIVLLALLAVAFSIAAFIQTLGAGMNDHRQPTATETPTDNVNQTAWPPDGWKTFSIRAGPTAPADWSGPYRVEIATPTVAEWRSGFVVTVYEGQEFAVDLQEGERYELVVEAANGERRLVGTFQAGELPEPVNVQVYPCCVDDFGTPAQEAESR